MLFAFFLTTYQFVNLRLLREEKSNNEDEIQRFQSCLLWLPLHVSFFVLPLVIDDQYHDYATVTTSSLVPIVVVA